MFRDYKGVIKILILYLATIALCRFTKGLGVFMVAFVAMYYIARRRMGPVLFCYMLIPILTNTNSVLLGSGMFGMASRICVLFMTAVIVAQAGRRHGRHFLPLGGLYLFLAVAAISSIGGYFPMISYLKILNFLIFLLGVHVGTKNLHRRPEELMVVRDGILALAIVYIIGSFFTYFVPSVGFAMEINSYLSWGAQGSVDDLAARVVEKAQEGMALFSGMTNHSQTLAPMTVAFAAWTLCDMLFCVRKMSWLHVVILGFAPVVLFMTRSRTGLLGMAVSMTMIYFYAIPHAQVSLSLRRRFRNIMFGGVFLLGIAMVIMQIRGGKMTSWVRKTGDVASDQRGLVEAVVSTRMGAVEANMYDFHKNPIFGMGFQVEPEHPHLYQIGAISLFSAPIEKGLLPLMVLGETGAVGGLVFLGFLIAFYNTCNKKKYIVTASLFTMMLAVNMGEAVFFSPAAVGGVIWIITVVGGFVIDMRCVGVRQQDWERMMMARLNETVEAERCP